MKKISLAVLIAACSISQIIAQVHFGLKGGVNFENFEIKNDIDGGLTLENSTGWQIGALLQVKIPGTGAGIQPEILYTVCKAKVDDEVNSIRYFEVPLNLRLGFNLFLVRPYLSGGPYFGYAVQLDGDIFQSQINKFNWGVGLGGGAEIWKFQMDARYSWGLQNVSGVEQFELKNNRFTLSLAFLF